MKIIRLLFLLLLVFSCTSKSKLSEISLPESLDEAVASPIRSPDFTLRDIYRHPLETLSFFGIKSDMTVVEIWPSGGWYTQILAPFLASKGQYIIADPPTDPKGYTNRRKEWLEKYPDIADKIETIHFLPPATGDLAPVGSVDMILTFRNVHNWQPQAAQEMAFKSFYRALKPGGILGVVEHRAPKNKKKFDAKSGYVLEESVIQMAKKAGFKIADKSEVNANPKDTKIHPEGVWTLPPVLRLGEKDRSKYIEIGESDRMTLKFVKPEN